MLIRYDTRKTLNSNLPAHHNNLRNHLPTGSIAFERAALSSSDLLATAAPPPLARLSSGGIIRKFIASCWNKRSVSMESRNNGGGGLSGILLKCY